MAMGKMLFSLHKTFDQLIGLGLISTMYQNLIH